MLKEESDIRRLQELTTSLEAWAKATNNSLQCVEFEKNTESLYRFGWFIINGYKYSISGWKFLVGIVVFENELDGTKIKYNIPDKAIIGTAFRKDTWVVSNIKKIRRILSNLLRKLSDKLQP